jgi:hypothetical protein
MTPKEKAKELFDKYVHLSEISIGDYESEKSMCLIAVDEILRSHHNLYGLNNKKVKFYLEVQQEIKKL